MNDYSGYYLLIPQKEEHLSHHGIKGQKWGVKHGPPYPLKGEDRVKIGKTYYINEFTVLPYLAVGAVKRAAAKSRLKADDKRRSKVNKIDRKTGFRLKDREYSVEEDLKKINPGYAQSAFLTDKKTANNCAYCTTAYEMRRRGYDVRAKKAEDKQGLYDSQIDVLWKFKTPIQRFSVQERAWKRRTEKDKPLNKYEEKYHFTGETRADRLKTYEDTIGWIKKQPNQRGNLCVNWGFAGHSMAYEIKDGKLTILDGQSGKSYPNGEKYLKELFGTGIFSDLRASDCSFRRTDNATPNWDEIKKRVE